ncbi:hypothetical protein [Sorangium sp. So ce887]|uniref:hypothetical protein n=1 Tax=Sorangium sp. So ce887 TaxID=3133324 RepID=UPI003F610F06
MSRIKTGKICAGFGIALTALAFAGCLATPADADESLGVAEQAFVNAPPGTRVPCTMSGGPTGRRRANLVVGNDQRTCYRVPLPGDIPEDPSVPSCHSVGYSMGCEFISR